jgi:predicted DNA-binding ribbon-helix-helix protein
MGTHGGTRINATAARPNPLRLPASPQARRELRFENGGRKATARLEKPFLMGFKEAAVARNMSSTGLVREIAKQSPVNLSSAVRVFVLEFYRNQIKQHQIGRINRELSASNLS